MYNAKSRMSAILTIVTAVLLIVLMSLIPFMQYVAEEEEGIAAIFIVLISFLGYPFIYASAVPFVVVALVFGILMLVQQSPEKLISYNVRMLITTCVLAPFLGVVLLVGSSLIFPSSLGVVPIILTIAVIVTYIASFVTQIVTISLLKNSQ